MFERLQKPFLTVETGEAYQPVQVAFIVSNKVAVIDKINSIKCLFKKNGNELEWEWRWQDECAALPFNSLVASNSPSTPPTPSLAIGTLHLEKQYLLLRVHSFKRACLAVSFFIQYFNDRTIQLDHADFINKVFPMGEHPHGFSELFDDHELTRLSDLRLKDYQRINQLCEHAKDADEALHILQEYTHKQAEQPLPESERYIFPDKETDPEVISLSFYIFLRGRELVAIRRWFGASTYNLAKAMDETIEQVFGDLDLDSLS